ncbi:MAG: sugar nucleotide-binding protein, partial [Chloroflexota bacterium]
YGAAKAYADGFIISAMPEALIVRPSLIYGFDPIDKQTAWLVDGIKKKQTVKLFVDEYRCPIWVDNLAQALLEVAESKLSGILNVAGPQRLNRWEYGLKLLNHLKIDPEGYVVKSSITESGTKRPADLTLDIRKAQRVLKTKLLSVDEVIRDA